MATDTPAAPPSSPPDLTLDRSLALWADAERLIPGGSQTNSKRPAAYAFGKYPIFAARADGCRIWDVDGNEYVDYVNGLGPVTLGYRYPAVDGAVREQLDKGFISGLLWPAEVEAARGLSEAIPCAEQVRFFKGGGEATAAAARIARAFTGRHVILNAGYRGWPDTWSASRDSAVPPDVAKYVVSFPTGNLARVEQLLDQHKGQVAAIFTDLPYDASLDHTHLQGLQDLARAHDALLAFDEIVNGFRLARGGMQEHYGVVPDLAAFAKGMANGMPLAAVAGRGDVMAAAKDALISITYGGEALSLAACVAVLKEYQRQPVIKHLWTVGQRLMDGLNAAAEASRVPFRCTGYPPMSAMTFSLPAEKISAAWGLFLAELAKRGVLMRRGGLNMMTFSHAEADVDQTARAATEAFDVLAAQGFAGDASAEMSEARGQQVGPWSPTATR
ncbi:MAG TPA: aminotransferase class III-fold pyridoxal phosphate-dependent enzyme [Chloroflexota bacterium]|nr:aminotransferase class III-fold pyridoxal phosphate-dependent enzyme [Chloroflexota bacterium]